MNYLKHIFTARNGEDFSFTKLLAFTGGTSLIYNFLLLKSADFQGFGIALAAIIGTLAYKYSVESPK